jgi:hypothetical protein
MRRVTKRLFLLVSVCALCVAALATPSAHASQSGTCDFDGVVGVDPPIPPAGWRPDVTGTYTMSARSHACVVTDSAGNAVANGTADITSGGTFSSIQCGTANARGSAMIRFSTGQTFMFDITVFAVANHGVLQMVNGAAGSGVVEIVPGDIPPPVGGGFGGNCVTTSVSQFRIRGAFSMALP